MDHGVECIYIIVLWWKLKDVSRSTSQTVMYTATWYQVES